MRKCEILYPQHNVTVIGETPKKIWELSSQELQSGTTFQFAEWLQRKNIVIGIYPSSAVAELYRGETEWKKMSENKINGFNISYNKALSYLKFLEGRTIIVNV